MIRFNYLSDRCKKLTDSIDRDIPQILYKLESYEACKPLKRDNQRKIIYPDIVNKCASKIRKIEGFDTTILDENLSTLIMSRTYGKSLLLSADYDIGENHMRIGSISNISHEMLHVATSKYDSENDVCYSGFFIYSNEINIGRQFTEGFTELLNVKHFDVDQAASYEYFRRYVKQFQETFPNIDFIKYYSTADLKGLLNEITKYGISKEDCLTYIYLLGKFKPLYFGIVEDYLREYREDFKAKVKRIEN